MEASARGLGNSAARGPRTFASERGGGGERSERSATGGRAGPLKPVKRVVSEGRDAGGGGALFDGLAGGAAGAGGGDAKQQQQQREEREAMLLAMELNQRS